MSKIKSLMGVLKTFLQMAKEDWYLMDHKLLRIVGGIVVFGLVAFFWLFFFAGSSPFRLFG